MVSLLSIPYSYCRAAAGIEKNLFLYYPINLPGPATPPGKLILGKKTNSIIISFLKKNLTKWWKL